MSHSVEAAYADPHEFIPERWYSRPELVKDKRAFAPFGIGQSLLLPRPMLVHTGELTWSLCQIGRTSCVGRHLALAQIRLVAAGLLFQYRIRFADGENNGEAVERDMKDQLTAQPGACRLIFERRV